MSVDAIITGKPPDDVSAQGLTGCIIDNCGKPLVGRGRCRRHYAQWYRATPKDQRTKPQNLKRLTPAERFAQKLDQCGPDECWPWTATKNRFGHGQFFVSRERGTIPAHVFALELATGERCPDGLEGCHRCDNPPCCNPAHIYYGTRQQNVDDMHARGRAVIGSRAPQSKLTDTAVLEIRTRFAAGEYQTTLAAEFGISDSQASHIVNGQAWKHVGGPIRTHGRPGRRAKKEFAA